jgi:hypothetical protein
VRRISALLAGVAAGALGTAAILRRRRVEPVTPADDPRAEDLRRKLAEARRAAAEEDEVEAAERGTAKTAADDPPAVAPTIEADPPSDEFEAMRRRVHDEARAAAEEMRRSGDDPSNTSRE